MRQTNSPQIQQASRRLPRAKGSELFIVHARCTTRVPIKIVRAINRQLSIHMEIYHKKMADSHAKKNE